MVFWLNENGLVWLVRHTLSLVIHSMGKLFCFIFCFVFFRSLSQSSFFLFEWIYGETAPAYKRQKNNECPRVSLMLNMCRFRCPFNFRALNCEINTFKHTNKKPQFFFHMNSMVRVFCAVCVSVSLLLLQMFCLLLLWMSSQDCLRFEYTRASHFWGFAVCMWVVY